ISSIWIKVPNRKTNKAIMSPGSMTLVSNVSGFLSESRQHRHVRMIVSFHSSLMCFTLLFDHLKKRVFKAGPRLLKASRHDMRLAQPGQRVREHRHRLLAMYAQLQCLRITVRTKVSQDRGRLSRKAGMGKAKAQLLVGKPAYQLFW